MARTDARSSCANASNARAHAAIIGALGIFPGVLRGIGETLLHRGLPSRTSVHHRLEAERDGQPLAHPEPAGQDLGAEARVERSGHVVAGREEATELDAEVGGGGQCARVGREVTRFDQPGDAPRPQQVDGAELGERAHSPHGEAAPTRNVERVDEVLLGEVEVEGTCATPEDLEGLALDVVQIVGRARPRARSERARLQCADRPRRVRPWPRARRAEG